jgi:ADP-ribose pyrophosphatase YjhB (NUDIX family)
VVFSKDFKKVLLCKRKGESDLDGIFSFIGGKMETTDLSIIEGMQREKNEEIGEEAIIKLYPRYSTNLLFRKKDGNSMILPHYLAVYVKGDVNINDEYSEYKWVMIDELNDFEPKVSNIPQTVETLLQLIPNIKDEEFIII